MFSVDQWLIEAFKNNWMTLTAIYVLLCGIAKNTEWTWDEKIVNIIADAFASFRPGKKV